MNITAGAEVTVKVALQVTACSQLLTTFQITVLLPPQKDGAPVLLLLIVALHPPLKVVVANHAA